MAIAEAGGVAPAETVVVRSVVGEPFDRIVGYSLGPRPEAVSARCDLDLDDVPF